MSIYKKAEQLRNDLGKQHYILIALTLVISAGVGLAYHIDLTDTSSTFQTNATLLDPGKNSENLSVGIATGQGMSYGRFNADVNKTRSLNLSTDSLTLVTVSTEGNISESLHYERKHLFEGRKMIEVKMEGNKTGYYEGEISLQIKNAENQLSEKWLEILYYFS